MTRLFKRAISATLDRIFDTPSHPITQEEELRVAEFRTRLAQLAPQDPSTFPNPEARWSSNVRRLRELVENADPREFLRWDVVSRTMFIGNALYVRYELRYLRRRPDWTSRWSAAIVESPVGRPKPYFLFPRSSGNLLHHAYHLARFEDTTSCRVDRLELVVEFGGGYGGMCRLFHNLGFDGIYVMYDLPEFCELQRFYLRSLRIPVLERNDDILVGGGGVLFVSDLEDLHRLSGTLKDSLKMKSLLIATWSISETSCEFRDRFFDIVAWPRYQLLAFQRSFCDVENVTYFRNFVERRYSGDWSFEEIRHRPLSNYLFGRSNVRCEE